MSPAGRAGHVPDGYVPRHCKDSLAGSYCFGKGGHCFCILYCPGL